jgi:nucleoside-diphosphate-sugar epimerase
MRALVTGATGFVGSHLVEELQRQGASVTALVRSPGKASALGWRDVSLAPGDLEDSAALAKAAQNQDVVFHLAGLVAAANQEEFDRANSLGTANLIRAVHQSAQRPRLIFVSSFAAGGPTVPGAPLTGTEPPKPVTQYGRSKLAAETMVRESGLPWTILRPPMVYGQRDREVLRVFRLARLGVAPQLGTGRQELSAIFGPDLATGLVAAAATERTVGRVYLPCHERRFTSEDFLRSVGYAVAEATGRPGATLRIVTVPEPVGRALLTVTGALAGLVGKSTILTADKANEFFAPAWTGDPSPLTRDTGWQAQHDLPSGLAITATWYRSAGWL